MEVKKPEQLASVDDNRNPGLNYHYSRREREGKRISDPGFESPQKKGLGRFMGGNKNAGFFVAFYIALAVFFWLFLYLRDNAQEMETRRVFNLSGDRKMEARRIVRAGTNGINLLFQNGPGGNWDVGTLKLESGEYSWSTNLGLKIGPQEFEVLFIPLPEALSNISRLNLSAGGPR